MKAIPRQASSDQKPSLPRQISADQLMFLNKTADHGMTSYKQTADHPGTSQAPKPMPRKLSTDQMLPPVINNKQIGKYA